MCMGGGPLICCLCSSGCDMETNSGAYNRAPYHAAQRFLACTVRLLEGSCILYAHRRSNPQQAASTWFVLVPTATHVGPP
jgi:hypothetical protein